MSALAQAPSQWADYIAPPSHRAHGTYVKYVVEHCHCEPCRKANRDYERNRQRKMSRPDEVWVPYVPAGRARQHIRELMAQGVGPKTIAKLSGVSHGSLSKLMYGTYRGTTRRRVPSRRIRSVTERKILSVRIEDVDGAQKIPAEPTWRLLDDLIGRGFPKSWLARRLGATAKTTHPGLQISRVAVRASTARKVEQLHRCLQGAEPPPPLHYDPSPTC